MGDMSNMAKPWTHRDYYRLFSLNEEQYGEILITHIFGGTKMGDAQRGYDVETQRAKVRRLLLRSGASREDVKNCLSRAKTGKLRIEVKSKLAWTPTGPANVIHCSDTKIKRTRRSKPATHFAVVLFDGKGEGTAEHAWFFSTNVARTLRTKDTKSRYIPVSSLKKPNVRGPIITISGLINEAARRPLRLRSS